MKSVIVIGLVAAVLLVLLALKWRRTDWDRVDRGNEKFIDKDGNHSYYDRHK